MGPKKVGQIIQINKGTDLFFKPRFIVFIVVQSKKKKIKTNKHTN